MAASLVTWTDTLRGILRAREKTRGTHFLAADPLRLLSFIVRRERHRGRRMRELGVPIPSYCMLSVTGRCNLACSGCYAKSFGDRGDMAPDLIRRVVAEAEYLGIQYVIVVGGEPLVVPGLLDILTKARRTIFFLYTNATLLDERSVARIARA
ncbi:MAG: radical SAM protein, partial [Planctomycetota bacterium]